jgi:hypothetical protein
MASNSTISRDKKWAYRRELWLASGLVAVGLVLSGVSVLELAARPQTHAQMAQATQPLQSSPPTSDTKPADPIPGGARPTTPAPEPARPDAEAQKAGATPVLPPAPAEKTAAPIQSK